MELDDLKTTWNIVNSRLDEMHAGQLAMQRAILRSQTKTAANRLRLEPMLELIAGCVTVIWSGGFLADNVAKIRLAPIAALPAGLLYALGIFTIWLSIRQLMIISSMDYSNPIVEAQKKIAALRSLRVRSTQFMLLIGIPLWAIFPLLAGQAVFGFDFVKAVSVPWLLGNLVFGVIASLGIILAARKFGAQSVFFQKINEIFAGTEIAKAQKLLVEVNDFAQA